MDGGTRKWASWIPDPVLCHGARDGTQTVLVNPCSLQMSQGVWALSGKLGEAEICSKKSEAGRMSIYGHPPTCRMEAEAVGRWRQRDGSRYLAGFQT